MAISQQYTASWVARLTREAAARGVASEGRERLEPKLARWLRLWEDQMAAFSDAELNAGAWVIERIADMLESLPG